MSRIRPGTGPGDHLVSIYEVNGNVDSALLDFRLQVNIGP